VEAVVEQAERAAEARVVLKRLLDSLLPQALPLL
jgi:hypothetical protein